MLTALAALCFALSPPPLTPEQQVRLKEVQQLAKEFNELKRAGKLADAAKVAEKVLADARTFYQPAARNRRNVIIWLAHVGNLRFDLDDWQAARAARKERADLMAEEYGKSDWRVTDARLALADVDSYEKMTGEERTVVRRAVRNGNEANTLAARGEFTAATALLDETYAACRRTVGEDHPDTIAALSSRVVVFMELTKFADAEPLAVRALEGARKTFGDDHPNTVKGVANLAAVYGGLGRDADAEPLLNEGVAGFRKLVGDNHLFTLTAQGNLAKHYLDRAMFSEAEPLLKSDIAVWRKMPGDLHPHALTTLDHLGILYLAQERAAAAEPVLKEAVAVARKTLGDTHPHTLQYIRHLGVTYDLLGQRAEAGPLLAEALAGTRRLLDRFTLVQSERDAIALRKSSRLSLDNFLAFGLAAKTPAAERYAEVLAWKGAAFTRQSQLRAAVAQTDDPEVKKLFVEAGTVARQLANLTSATPPADQLADYRKKLKELADRKDDIDQQLARKSAAFRKAKETAALTPEQLAEALPADVALIDYLEYTHSTPDPDKKGGWKGERRLLAYVVRNGKPVVEVELGAVKPVAEAVDKWRETIGRTTPTTAAKDDPAVALRKAVWEPVAKAVGDAKVVLVSPDGALARLPFAALPGADPKKYLLEEIAIAVAPVPQLIPELLADKPKPPKDPALLLMGDVDFDADGGKPDVGTTGRTADRSDRGAGWERLKATADEVAAIRDAFEQGFPDGKAKVLRKAAATEAAVRQLAPQHQYLHVATHGFFTPPRPAAKSADTTRGFEFDLGAARAGAAGTHPGLQSGLVLAGANQPPKADADDGILTALEVAELDLSRVEVAVLSACETKLGKEVSAEGVIGLERAFRTAGARTVVSSLWKVDDRATQLLMSRFYRNLWEEKMGRVEALREAQRWMLAEGVRGLVPVDELPKDGEKGRTPPKLWAAFALSGDWR